MRAKRSLGQNFLVDPNLQRKIVEALEPGPSDTVIEIGPGRGALTQHLVGRVGHLVAVELDDDLAPRLAERFRDQPHVRIVHADVLEWDPAAVLGGAVVGGPGPPAGRGEGQGRPDGGAPSSPVKVVGNIPYNITSPILFRLLEWRPAPERVVLMVQKEVADRLLASPGEKAYGALTVGVRAEADVERLFEVRRGAFRPVPNVDSTVIRVAPGVRSPAGDRLRALTRAAFGMRRKQLQKILRTAPGYGLRPAEAEAVLAGVGLAPQDRPEVVDPPTFVALAGALERLGYPATREETSE